MANRRANKVSLVPNHASPSVPTSNAKNQDQHERWTVPLGIQWSRRHTYRYHSTVDTHQCVL